MAQNISSAVMQQRAEPHDSLDYFPTPPWATRALCEWLEDKGQMLDELNAWEPACGGGHMARPLGEYFGDVFASDVHDYRGEFPDQHSVSDFLIRDMVDLEEIDWVITNPPFKLAEQFIGRASQVARHGFAMLVRTAFLEGVGRYNNLFSVNPPSYVLQFAERVPMWKGRLTATGGTATAYCWLVWIKDEDETKFGWLAPCRKRLERPDDYAGCEE